MRCGLTLGELGGLSGAMGVQAVAKACERMGEKLKTDNAPEEKRLFTETPMKCPYCEGENSNARVSEDKQNKEYFVYCPKCGIETKDFFTSKEKAVKAFESGENRDIPKEELK